MSIEEIQKAFEARGIDLENDNNMAELCDEVWALAQKEIKELKEKLEKCYKLKKVDFKPKIDLD